MSLTVTSEVTEAEWNAFIESHPDASGYHLWQWRHVFERAFGHETEYVVAREHGRVTAALPLVIFQSRWFGKFMVSLPFVNYGGVLSSHPLAAHHVLEYATCLAKDLGMSHVELRHTSRLYSHLPVKTHKVAMRVSLPQNAAVMWAGLDRKTRNQIKKAEKSGLTAAIGGAELLHCFYEIFAHNMRDLGTPVYPFRFFEEMCRQFPERTRIFLVKSGETVVAGAIGYGYQKTFEIPSASSLKAWRSLCPGNLLYWSAIQFAIAEGYSTFDFGRSSPNDGTFHFKRQWGALPQPLCWEYELFGGSALPDRSPKNPKFRMAIALWKRLPVSVATLLGPHVVRSIP